MNFLPYDRIRPGQWTLPFAGSLLFHGAALLLFSTATLVTMPPKNERPELVVSLEILDLESYGDIAPIAEVPENIPADENAESNLNAPFGATPDENTSEEVQNTPEAEASTVEEPAPEEAEDIAQATTEEVPQAPEEIVAEVEPLPQPAAEVFAQQETPPQPVAQSVVEDSFISPLAETGGYAPSPFSGDISLETPGSLFPRTPQPDTPLNLAALEPPSATESGPDIDPAPSSTGLGTPLANASASDLVIAQLLTRIRNSTAPRCTLALPRRNADGQVGLSLIGADRTALNSYSAELLADLDTVTRVREEIDPRQCAALDAVALSSSYPATRIGFSLAATSVQSGDNIEARIVGAGGLDIAVLLIDDNGVVQDLARFTTIEDGVPVISAPVARAGQSRETRQLLMVLGSGNGAFDLTDMDGRMAEEVFSSLNRSLLEQSAFALASFDVR
ncbi:hypothetical protein [Celeribacter halophilus]|uniref:hypothetical protein n=1 Tax=Celeribacter halophilus TaxID=576117 RepID=UPI003A8C8C5A